MYHGAVFSPLSLFVCFSSCKGVRMWTKSYTVTQMVSHYSSNGHLVKGTYQCIHKASIDSDCKLQQMDLNNVKYENCNAFKATLCRFSTLK